MLPEGCHSSITVRDPILLLLGQFGVRLAVVEGLEYGVPAKVTGASRLHNGSFGDALEEHWRLIGALGKGQGANGPSRLILPAAQQPL